MEGNGGVWEGMKGNEKEIKWKGRGNGREGIKQYGRE